jgi:hypothetical protein
MPCPICNAFESSFFRDLQDHFTDHKFTAVQCSNCGGIYLSNAPNAESIGQYYNNVLGSTMWSKGAGLFQVLNAFALKREFSFLQQYLKPKSLIVDLGSGSGSCARTLQAMNYEVHARDMYSPLDWRDKEIPFKQVNLSGDVLSESDILCDGKPPTLVLLRHVLEHLIEPRKVLQTCHKSGAQYVLIFVPNVASCFSRLFPQSWYYWDPPRHLTFFTPRTLELLLQNAGFSALRTWTYGIDELVTTWYRNKLLKLHSLSDRDVAQRRLESYTSIAGPKSVFAAFSSALSRPFGSNVVACLAKRS